MKAYMHLKKQQKLQGGQSLSILFNYNTCKVVVSLSDSSDSLLVMVSTNVALARSAAKGELAPENDIYENVAANSADEINTAQPELMRNIFMLTKDQMLEAQLDQEKFMVIQF
jgi:hypothetical protein